MSADATQKKRSWTAKYIPRPGSSSGRSSSGSLSGRPSLPTAEEGKELQSPQTPSPSLPSSPIASSVSLPLGGSRPSTADSTSGASTPRRRSSVLTPPIQSLDAEATSNGLERTISTQQGVASPGNRASGAFSKSFSSMMMGGLSSLSLSRTSTRDSTNAAANDDRETRGRTMAQMTRVKSASQAPPETESSRSRSRARSTSPFSFRRFRQRDRDPSPPTEAIPLGHSDVDLSDSASFVRPHATSYDSGDDTVGDETEDEDWSEDDFFDPVTERNTERNAIIAPVPQDGGIAGVEDVDPDPLGEGVNVVVPPEPYFPSTLNSSTRAKRNPRRRKSTKHHEPLALETSRPVFQRDRCTITITQGDPIGKLGGRGKRRYVVASDLSEESRYAVEWAIGTVLRDGDDLLIVTVTENDSKGMRDVSSVTSAETKLEFAVDPPIPNTADRTTKLRSQQEVGTCGFRPCYPLTLALCSVKDWLISSSDKPRVCSNAPS